MAGDRRSDAVRARRRRFEGQICGSWLADLGDGAQGGPGGRRALLGRTCAPNGSAKGLDFEYWLGVQKSPLFANTFVVRGADLDDPDKKGFLEKYLRGWAMGLEFGYENPRAAVEAVFEQFPSLASNLGPKLGTTSCLQQTNVFRGDMSKRAGWGDHNMQAWQLFFDKIYQLKQITKPVKAEDVCTNVLIAGANAFDRAKVKADAANYKLSQPFAELDLDNIKAHLFDQAIPANR